MSGNAERAADDRAILLARVDELSVIVGALVRAMEETRHGFAGQMPADLTQDSIVEFLNSVEADLAYVRGMADAHLHQAIAAEASLSTAQDELANLHSRLATAEATVAEWADECGLLRSSRDQVVEDLLALQQGRWMRLGRVLGVGRRTQST